MTHNSSEGHSRRTVVKAAAWSLPVLALAVAAPAASASTALRLAVSTFCPEAPFQLGGFRLLAVNGDIPAGAVITLTSTGYDVASLDTPPGFANGGTSGGIRVFALASGLAEGTDRNFTLSAGLPVSVGEPTDFTLSVESVGFGAGMATLTLEGAEFPAMSLCPVP